MGKNRVTGHFKIEERATKKNRIARHFKRGKKMKDVNGDIFEVGFLDQGIIKCN